MPVKQKDFKIDVSELLEKIGNTEAIPVEEFKNCGNEMIKETLNTFVTVSEKLKTLKTMQQELAWGSKREKGYSEKKQQEENLWEEIHQSIQGMGDLSGELSKYHKGKSLARNHAAQKAIQLGFACQELKAMAEAINYQRICFSIIQTNQEVEDLEENVLEDEEKRENRTNFIQAASELNRCSLFFKSAEKQSEELSKLKAQRINGQKNEGLEKKIQAAEKNMKNYSDYENDYKKKQENCQKVVDENKERWYQHRIAIVEKQRKLVKLGDGLNNNKSKENMQSSMQLCLENFYARAMDKKKPNHEDSREFQQMYNAIGTIAKRMKEEGANYSNEQLNKDMDNLKRLCTTYIEEKQKGLHLFKNTQRTVRLNFANSVLNFAESMKNIAGKIETTKKEVRWPISRIEENRKIGDKNKTMEEYVAGLVTIGKEPLTDRADNGMEMLDDDVQMINEKIKLAQKDWLEMTSRKRECNEFFIRIEMGKNLGVGENRCLEKYLGDIKDREDYQEVRGIYPESSFKKNIGKENEKQVLRNNAPENKERNVKKEEAAMVL